MSQHTVEKIKAQDKRGYVERGMKGRRSATAVFLRLLSCWYSWSGREGGGVGWGGAEGRMERGSDGERG